MPSEKPTTQLAPYGSSAVAAMAAARFQLRIAISIHAILDLVAKWLAGVLIGKVVVTASATPGATDMKLSPFYSAVLLEKLSFGTVAGLGFGVVVVLILALCAEKALAVRLATLTGRDLRQKILSRAVGGTTASSRSDDLVPAATALFHGDCTTGANELVRRVSLVEDFAQNEEPLIAYCQLKLLFSTVFIYIVIWEAGLIMLTLLLVGEGLKFVVEKKRHPFHENIENNRYRVHARLLDSIKNAVMIFTTKMATDEANALQVLEHSSDAVHQIDEKLRFARDLACLPLALAPIAVPVFAWLRLMGTTSPTAAFEIGTAVLIALMVGDEGHKSTLQLALVADREVAAREASVAIVNFLGEKSDDFSSKDGKVVDSCHSLTIGQTAHDDGSDEEMASSSASVSAAMPRHVSVIGTSEITLREVTLLYPDRTNPVLNQVNISFARGKIHG
eukprot:scaffold6577_cov175-Amphora_coffeaeformis.AAC.5